jgi:hypothetical protein
MQTAGTMLHGRSPPPLPLRLHSQKAHACAAVHAPRPRQVKRYVVPSHTASHAVVFAARRPLMHETPAPVSARIQMRGARPALACPDLLPRAAACACAAAHTWGRRSTGFLGQVLSPPDEWPDPCLFPERPQSGCRRLPGSWPAPHLPGAGSRRLFRRSTGRCQPRPGRLQEGARELYLSVTACVTSACSGRLWTGRGHAKG